MTPIELRRRAKTGDLLLVKSEGVVGKLVRCATGESYSHVALLVWVLTDTGRELTVFEFVEGTGHQSMTLTQWLAERDEQKLTFGIAPAVVHANSTKVQTAAEVYNSAGRLKRSYGYLSLFKVWLSQLLRCRISVRQKVCSTYAQEVWAAGCYDQIPVTADPGDFGAHCQALFPLWR